MYNPTIELKVALAKIETLERYNANLLEANKRLNAACNALHKRISRAKEELNG